MFDKFQTAYVQMRDAGKIQLKLCFAGSFIYVWIIDKKKYRSCKSEAGNDVDKVLHCARDHIMQTKADNEKLLDLFKKEYPQYL